MLSKLKKQAYRRGFGDGKNNLHHNADMINSEFSQEYLKGFSDGAYNREIEIEIAKRVANRKPKFR